MNPISGAIEAARVAYQAGFRGSSLVLAVAIAGAESGYNSQATGDVNIQSIQWGPSVGLWQIRTLKPEYLHLEPIRNVGKLYNPLENAKAAFTISRGGTDWKPWGAYTNAAYKKYEEIARQAAEAFEEIKKKTPILLCFIVLIVIAYFLLK